MKRVLLVAAVLLIPAAGASADDELEAREQAAQRVAGALLKELGGHLKAELERGGPAEAIKVCRDIAPAIANRLSLETGWKVTRVGTRVRNPMIGTPDVWEQQVLARFRERAATGEPLAGMKFSEVVSEPEGRYFRFMKAVPVAPMCTLCHGDPEAMPESVRTVLKERYPHDRAVGYRAGELRGAVSIKQPLDIPLAPAE